MLVEGRGRLLKPVGRMLRIKNHRPYDVALQSLKGRTLHHEASIVVDLIA